MRKKFLMLTVFVLCYGVGYSMLPPDMSPGQTSNVSPFDDDGDEPPTEDPPPPPDPINSYVYLLLALGISVGYVVFRRASPVVSHSARPRKNY